MPMFRLQRFWYDRKERVGIKDDGLGVKWSMKEDIGSTARLDLTAS